MHNLDITRLVKSLLLFLVSVIFLSLVAVYNGYPLVHSDSNSYIGSAQHFQPYFLRPAFMYSVLIYPAIHFKSLWIAILPQIFATSLVIVLFQYIILKHSFHICVATIVFLTFATTLSWNQSIIIADAFAGASILAALAILDQENLDYWKAIVISVCFVVSTSTHSAYLLAVLFFFIILALVYSVSTYFKYNIFALFGRRLIFFSTVVVGAWLTSFLLNYIVSGKTMFQDVGHVYTMSRLYSSGILGEYLNDRCGYEKYDLCEYKEEIPRFANLRKYYFSWNTDYPIRMGYFIWDKESPFRKSHGDISWKERWLSTGDEYRKIYRRSILAYPWLHIQAASWSIVKQISLHELGSDYRPYVGADPLYARIIQVVPGEVKEYVNSRQSGGRLVILRFARSMTKTILVLSGLVILFSVPLCRKRTRIHVLLLGILFGSHVLVTSIVSEPWSRYLERISWLIPFAMVIVMTDIFHQLSSKELRLLFTTKFPFLLLQKKS